MRKRPTPSVVEEVVQEFHNALSTPPKHVVSDPTAATIFVADDFNASCLCMPNALLVQLVGITVNDLKFVCD